jgi:hypothetical protein
MRATELTGYLLVVHGDGGELGVETLGEVGRAGGRRGRRVVGERMERSSRRWEGKGFVRKATGSRPDKEDGLSCGLSGPLSPRIPAHQS